MNHPKLKQPVISINPLIKPTFKTHFPLLKNIHNHLINSVLRITIYTEK